MRMNKAQLTVWLIFIVLSGGWGWYAATTWGVIGIGLAALGGVLLGVVSGVIIVNLD